MWDAIIQEKKTSAAFLAIKRWQRPKLCWLFNLQQSSKKAGLYTNLVVMLLNGKIRWHHSALPKFQNNTGPHCSAAEWCWRAPLPHFSLQRIAEICWKSKPGKPMAGVKQFLVSCQSTNNLRTKQLCLVAHKSSLTEESASHLVIALVTLN